MYKYLSSDLKVLQSVRILPLKPPLFLDFSMAGKGLKLVGCSSDASTPKSREIGRIMVKGFETGFPHDYVQCALRSHFSSCGEITDVYVPINYNKNRILRRYAFIYFVGEGAVDNALQLHGSDVGGWNVSVKPHPFPPHANDYVSVRVEGYDTSLSESDIKRALRKFFSSIGKIEQLSFIMSKSVAVLTLFGEDAAEKVNELDGSYMGRRKLAVRRISELNKSSVHRTHRPAGGYVIRPEVSDD